MLLNPLPGTQQKKKNWEGKGRQKGCKDPIVAGGRGCSKNFEVGWDRSSMQSQIYKTFRYFDCVLPSLCLWAHFCVMHIHISYTIFALPCLLSPFQSCLLLCCNSTLCFWTDLRFSCFSPVSWQMFVLLLLCLQLTPLHAPHVMTPCKPTECIPPLLRFSGHLCSPAKQGVQKGCYLCWSSCTQS